MKNRRLIVFLLALLTVVLAAPVFYGEEDPLAEIQALLENKTIKNYTTITNPLTGDPDGFNIRPTDDLNTLRFGQGMETYVFDYDALKKARDAGEQTIEDTLVKGKRYYFPVIVSDRVVALTAIEKSGDTYKVISTESGEGIENIAAQMEEAQAEQAKYIYSMPVANGFLFTEDEGERFVEMGALPSEENTLSANGQENLVEIMYQRYEEAQANRGRTGTGGTSGSFTESPEDVKRQMEPSTLWLAGGGAVVVVAGIAFAVFRLRRHE